MLRFLLADRRKVFRRPIGKIAFQLLSWFQYSDAMWIKKSFHHIGKSDRKSTRLNSSHLVISYAVFCLKKKKIDNSSLNNTLPIRAMYCQCRSDTGTFLMQTPDV